MEVLRQRANVLVEASGVAAEMEFGVGKYKDIAKRIST